MLPRDSPEPLAGGDRFVSHNGRHSWRKTRERWLHERCSASADQRKAREGKAQQAEVKTGSKVEYMLEYTEGILSYTRKYTFNTDKNADRMYLKYT